ncbi:hypothetical protein GIB67_005296 [Kingdonia uniflora]|uniref:Uncharacterized protein n=1 Tax=Kingdonia uniflora TaxID=39325 RepID=A0A7J7LCG5_9MAGN|nr:hypothetical protein GIB67_005296 [Kingdonia uniflora]
MTLLNSKLEFDMLELQSQLNALTVELSCKDAEILTTYNEAELWKESLKKKKLETMATNQQKQDAKIRHMRERLKKLNWDLREARDSCQGKIDRAKTHEETCSKKNREVNETINKYNSRIADLDREKQALILGCMQGNKVYEELHVKYKESQRLVDAADDEIKYSKKEKKSLADRCKDLEDELNKVKTELGEALLLTADDATLCTLAMLYADVEKLLQEHDSILATLSEHGLLPLQRVMVDRCDSEVELVLAEFEEVLDFGLDVPSDHGLISSRLQAERSVVSDLLDDHQGRPKCSTLLSLWVDQIEEIEPMEEEGGSSSTAPSRKVRFAPKIPSRKPFKPAEVKSIFLFATLESLADLDLLAQEEAANTRELLRRINVLEGSGSEGLNLKGKVSVYYLSVVPVQVAFGQGGTSNTIRTFGRDSSSNTGSGLEGPRPNDTNPFAVVPLDVPDELKKKDYVEPWDYYSYYPTVHPLRELYSGNPETLNEKEFGKASTNLEDDDEKHINSAAELELLDESEEPEMMFLQVPNSLPLVKGVPSARGKEAAFSSKLSRNAGSTQTSSILDELAGGSMGKMLVYKSGAVKLKLGAIHYDVSPGTDCIFSQEVAAICPEGKRLCVIGDLDKRATITPDVNHILDNIAELD